MHKIAIENEKVRLEVVPSYGARVVSLIDKRSERDWMAQGGESASVGEDASYLADEAVGWDECFPTVSVCDATETPWRRRLRDHGDLWGRPWSVELEAPTSLRTSYSDPKFRFTRTVTLEGNVVRSQYQVASLADEPLPYLWALHGLLAVGLDDRIEFDAPRPVSATYLSLGGVVSSARELEWPGPNPTFPRLDAVYPVQSHIAAKLYSSGIATRTAAVISNRGRLDITWDGEIDHLGVWLNYGGWPHVGNTHHIALEPTTAPFDHLEDALRAGKAKVIEPGGNVSWTISLALGAR